MNDLVGSATDGPGAERASRVGGNGYKIGAISEDTIYDLLGRIFSQDALRFDVDPFASKVFRDAIDV